MSFFPIKGILGSKHHGNINELLPYIQLETKQTTYSLHLLSFNNVGCLMNL